MTNDKYLKEFKAQVKSINVYSACILENFHCLVETKIKKYGKDTKSSTENEITACQEKVKKEVVTAMFLHGSDKF